MSTVMVVTNSNRPNVVAWVVAGDHGSYGVKLRTEGVDSWEHGLDHLTAIFKAQAHCADI